MKEVPFTLPILAPPFPDELMLNYSLRLGRMNLLGSNHDIIRYFFNKQCLRRYDTLIPLSHFLNVFNFDDPMEIFYKTSVVPVIFPFIDDAVTKSVMKVLFVNDKGKISYSRFGHITSNPKICPCCAKDDLKTYGEVYLHRSHQVVGVNKCYKHHCLLLEGEKGISLTNIHRFEKYKINPRLANGEEDFYVEFIYRMLNDISSLRVEDFTYDFFKDIVRRLRCLYTGYNIRIRDIESMENYEETKKRFCLFLKFNTS